MLFRFSQKLQKKVQINDCNMNICCPCVRRFQNLKSACWKKNACMPNVGFMSSGQMSRISRKCVVNMLYKFNQCEADDNNKNPIFLYCAPFCSLCCKLKKKYYNEFHFSPIEPTRIVNSHKQQCKFIDSQNYQHEKCLFLNRFFQNIQFRCHGSV